MRDGVVAPDYPLPVAADWPELLAIVRDRVKPERDKLGDNPDGRHRKKFWWQWRRRTPALDDAMSSAGRVIVISRVTQPFAFAFVPSNVVVSERVVVFPFESNAEFAILQSRVHEIWARFFSSTLEDRLTYAPSDCFETFPFPKNERPSEQIEESGCSYYEFRSSLMRSRTTGFTTLYNYFHDPESSDPEVLHLRALHDAMDRAILDAYGWTDIQPTCEFIPEFDDEESEDENGRPRKKKYRYRWPDEVRDEVLARLLDLNRQRALEEGQMIPEAPLPVNGKEGASRKKKSKKGDGEDGPLFTVQKGDA